MHAWEQIQQTVNYIEDHLNEEINIEDLAKTACLSPFYYQRLFRRLVKKPVAEYIRLRRMARAADCLLQSDIRILDIALELGFTSHEHFSRTFKNTFGLTPDEYRKNPQTLNRMTKPQLMLHYTLVDEEVPLITDGIVLEIRRKELKEPVHYMGLKKDVPIHHIDGLGTESGIDPLASLWDEFHKQKSALTCVPDETEEIGAAYSSLKEGCFSYFAGMPYEHPEIPSAFKSWELPAGEYIICSFEAESFEALVMDALYKAQHYIYNTWLPNRKLQTDAFCAERYASHSPDTTNMEIWLRNLT